MLILSLTYKTDIAKADAYMEAHLQWVDKGYERGWFLASGRKNPRTGGIILARGGRDEIAAFCKEDPFSIHGIADYEITEFIPTRVATGLELLK